MNALLEKHLPGYYEMRMRHYGTAAVQFVVFIGTLILIAFFHEKVLQSLESLILSAWLFIVAMDEGARIFQPAVIEWWVASVFLLLTPVSMWHFTRRRFNNLTNHDTHELSEWSLAWRQFKKQRLAVAAFIVVLVLYYMLPVTPFLAPYHPNAFQDGVVTQLKPPMSPVMALHLKRSRVPGMPIPWRGNDVPHANAINRVLELNRSILEEGISRIIHIDAFHVEGANVIATQGKSYIKVPIVELIAPDPAHFASLQYHVLGTDSYGRDLLSRVIYGSRVSLTLGLLAVLLSVSMGTVVGLCAGYFGKYIDKSLMRFVDVLLAFPSLFLILIIISVFETVPVPRILLVVLVLALTTWMGVARLVRGEVLSLKEREFIMAAQAMGLGQWRIIFRHILPNTLTPVIINFTLRIGGIILTEAALSYLNLGVQQPTASWGNIIFEGKSYLSNAWWISTFPGLAIVLTVVCFNLVGDGLRDAFDPRLKDSL